MRNAGNQVSAVYFNETPQAVTEREQVLFASQRLFLNSGFHWLSPLTQTADVTQEKGNGLFFFVFLHAN